MDRVCDRSGQTGPWEGIFGWSPVSDFIFEVMTQKKVEERFLQDKQVWIQANEMQDSR